MSSTYRPPEYPYVTPLEITTGEVARTQVAIVGAGPIGLAAAIDRLEAHPDGWQPDPQWLRELSRHAEGHQTTLGPYHRSWH